MFANNPEAPLLVGVPRHAPAPISLPQSKIGGSPVGFPEGLWPKCKQCHRPMDFLLQLDLAAPVRLSQKFAFMYMFMCHGYLDRPGGRACQTYYPWGANKLVLLEQLPNQNLTRNLGVQVWPEFTLDFVSKKSACEIDNEQDERGRASLEALKRAALGSTIHFEAADNRPQTVQLGGEPNWIQNEETPVCPKCGGATKLLTQVDSEVESPRFLEPKTDGVWLPFGSGGVAYAFICEKECSADSTCLMWQTT